MGFISDILEKTTLTDNLILFGGGDPEACANSVSVQLAPTDHAIRDVTDNWKTSGFYTVQQIEQIVDFGAAVRVQAGALLRAGQEQLQIQSQRAMLNKAFEDLVNNSNIGDLQWTVPIDEAKARGIEVIEAQGLKRWVIYVLKAAREAKRTALFVECVRPGGILGALGSIDSAVRAFVDVVKGVISAIADAAVAAGKAVLKIPDMISSLISFAKFSFWALLVGGSYYVAAKHELIPPKYEPLKLAKRTAGRETFRPWRRNA